MSVNLPDIKAFGTAPFEAFTAATASSTKGLQTIAAETTDYSKKSFEKSRVLFEKLTGVKKIDEAIQLQSDFAKSAYEDFVAHATRIGELYSSLAKEAFKPITVTSPAKPSVVAEPPKSALPRPKSRRLHSLQPLSCRGRPPPSRTDLKQFGATHLNQRKKCSINFCSSSIFSVGARGAQRRGQLSPATLSSACIARSSNGRALFFARSLPYCRGTMRSRGGLKVFSS